MKNHTARWMWEILKAILTAAHGLHVRHGSIGFEVLVVPSVPTSTDFIFAFFLVLNIQAFLRLSRSLFLFDIGDVVKKNQHGTCCAHIEDSIVVTDVVLKKVLSLFALGIHAEKLLLNIWLLIKDWLNPINISCSLFWGDNLYWS